MLSRIGLVALALSFAFVSVAKADGFILTGTGSSTDINIVISGTQFAPGVFDITSIDSGMIHGQNATLIPTTSPGVVTNTGVVNNWYIQFDNLLNLNGPFFDFYGLGFTLKDGTIANIYYNGGYLYTQLGDNPPFQEVVSLNVQTPEPGSLLMLCGGLLILGGLVTRKQLL